MSAGAVSRAPSGSPSGSAASKDKGHRGHPGAQQPAPRLRPATCTATRPRASWPSPRTSTPPSTAKLSGASVTQPASPGCFSRIAPTPGDPPSTVPGTSSIRAAGAWRPTAESAATATDRSKEPSEPAPAVTTASCPVVRMAFPPAGNAPASSSTSTASDTQRRRTPFKQPMLVMHPFGYSHRLLSQNGGLPSPMFFSVLMRFSQRPRARRPASRNGPCQHDTVTNALA